MTERLAKARGDGKSMAGRYFLGFHKLRDAREIEKNKREKIPFSLEPRAHHQHHPHPRYKTT